MTLTMIEVGQKRASKRPFVTLKLATSLDSKIATKTGQSKWITGPEARAEVHRLRAAHDCVLTGIGTVLADDPELTVRTQPAPAKQPLRVVLDSAARIPISALLLATQNIAPLCLFHRAPYAGAHTGAVHYAVSRDESGLNLHEVLAILVQAHGIERVMVEAGSRVAGAFLRARLVDEIKWFRAPLIIGGDGLSVFGGLGVAALAEALEFDRTDLSPCGRDQIETYVARPKDQG
jgi:diaminohydroxyphosphoribosylaminopyrimidine deaminase / 5-amino-6-(5-phosphoribosylamino)uracil reductase